MLLAPKVKTQNRHNVIGAIHEDGSCRAQSVNIEHNEFLHKLITAFYTQSQIPMLLNTSMNHKEEPLVETFHDALNWFNTVEANYLIINDLLISKKHKVNIKEKLASSILLQRSFVVSNHKPRKPHSYSS